MKKVISVIVYLIGFAALLLLIFWYANIQGQKERERKEQEKRAEIIASFGDTTNWGYREWQSQIGKIMLKIASLDQEGRRVEQEYKRLSGLSGINNTLAMGECHRSLVRINSEMEDAINLLAYAKQHLSEAQRKAAKLAESSIEGKNTQLTEPVKSADSTKEVACPVEIAVQFKLLGITYHADKPESSIALIDEPDKGWKWINQGDKVQQYTISKINESSIELISGNRKTEIIVPAAKLNPSDKQSSVKITNSEPPASLPPAGEGNPNAKSLALSPFSFEIPDSLQPFGREEMQYFQQQYEKQADQIYKQYNGEGHAPVNGVKIAAFGGNGRDSTIVIVIIKLSGANALLNQLKDEYKSKMEWGIKQGYIVKYSPISDYSAGDCNGFVMQTENSQKQYTYAVSMVHSQYPDIAIQMSATAPLDQSVEIKKTVERILSTINLLKKTSTKEFQIDGNARLIKAATDGNMQDVRISLSSGADLDARSKGGFTALMMAANYGHTEVVRLLLEKGANVNAKTSDGYTALMSAVRLPQCKTKIVSMLLEKGADVNAKTSGGTTALIVAAGSGCDRTGIIIWILLENGADVNARANAGDTALWHASMLGNTEIVKLLLEKGADVNVKTSTTKPDYPTSREDYTPLSIAKKNKHSEIVQLLEKAGAKE